MWIPGCYIRHTYPSKVTEWELAVTIRKSPKKPKGKVMEKRGEGPMDVFLFPGKSTEKRQSPSKRKENVPRSAMKGSIPRFQVTQSSPVKSTSPRKQSPKKAPSSTTLVPEISIRSPPTTPTKVSRKNLQGITRQPTQLPPTFTSFDDVARRLDEDSDSDSLPSPTDLLSYLPTPKTQRTATRVGVRGVEEGSPTPVAPRGKKGIQEKGSVSEIGEGGGRDGTPVRDGGIVGGFWESPGGTFHDLDD